jgi:hypothetical protein
VESACRARRNSAELVSPLLFRLRLKASNGEPCTMRLPRRRVALSLLAVLLSAPAPAQSAAPVASPQTPPAAATPSPATRRKPPLKKIRRRRRTRPRDPAQKVVVRHGGTTEALPQMAPVAPQHQDSVERRKSGQLLTATETNLKSLVGKMLTAEQQAAVAQVRQFMEQSRAALDAGDLTQGYNLAEKANVLSEELNKK